jgi:hypothetical protein
VPVGPVAGAVKVTGRPPTAPPAFVTRAVSGAGNSLPTMVLCTAPPIAVTVVPVPVGAGVLGDGLVDGDTEGGPEGDGDGFPVTVLTTSVGGVAADSRLANLLVPVRAVVTP